MPHYSYITRCESFSAAHRLHSPLMNAEDNLAIYGKCNHPNSHGHNYKVEVTMKGKVDPVTGMVINIKDLKECLQVVMENLDHRNLDKDVEYFFNKPSTTENLAIYIWNEFQKIYMVHANAPVRTARLYRVKIYETDSNHVEYMGEETPE
ncbi:hypothetical protein K450DRAFT_226428 [Umbelopsis ramanniana AG]|uniref:6-pyruvoyl tetrahydrobiopterin synthase n=1 Tax=Umbelopsis ramanniana AG TaxID=1314678 RepID=A0AAD5HH06_UMBRA|nr:uncharacterized protein K450DRAFT_226428 [Umbelopsis ramanniana AG]KAI8582689.1 hypothetical protein K450DRAFT_226428 [Umbelopsis ramanniana AG]